MKNKPTQKKSNPKLKLFLFGLLLVFSVVLLFLPADFFDNGPTICISMLLFKKKCLGCGLTRGVQHLIHFDFKTAWEYNKLTFVVLPLLIGMLIYEFIKTLKEFKAMNTKNTLEPPSENSPQ